MSIGEGWIEVVEPMTALRARVAYEHWKTAHPAAEVLHDDDVRIDLIRTVSGDLVRYLVRREAWRALNL